MVSAWSFALKAICAGSFSGLPCLRTYSRSALPFGSSPPKSEVLLDVARFGGVEGDGVEHDLVEDRVRRVPCRLLGEAPCDCGSRFCSVVELLRVLVRGLGDSRFHVCAVLLLCFACAQLEDLGLVQRQSAGAPSYDPCGPAWVCSGLESRAVTEYPGKGHTGTELRDKSRRQGRGECVMSVNRLQPAVNTRSQGVELPVTGNVIVSEVQDDLLPEQKASKRAGSADAAQFKLKVSNTIGAYPLSGLEVT
eukprot:5448648-Prymnesium_polylepis.1